MTYRKDNQVIRWTLHPFAIIQYKLNGIMSASIPYLRNHQAWHHVEHCILIGHQVIRYFLFFLCTRYDYKDRHFLSYTGRQVSLYKDCDTISLQHVKFTKNWYNMALLDDRYIKIPRTMFANVRLWAMYYVRTYCSIHIYIASVM